MTFKALLLNVSTYLSLLKDVLWYDASVDEHILKKIILIMNLNNLLWEILISGQFRHYICYACNQGLIYCQFKSSQSLIEVGICPRWLNALFAVEGIEVDCSKSLWFGINLILFGYIWRHGLEHFWHTLLGLINPEVYRDSNVIQPLFLQWIGKNIWRFPSNP